MSDQKPLGMGETALHVARQEPGGGRCDDGVGGRRGVDFGEDAALEIEALGHALLDELGAVDRLGDARGDSNNTSCRTRVAEQAGERALGVVEHLTRLAPGLRIRVEDRYVDAVEHEAGRPPAADHPTADARGAFDADRHGVPGPPPPAPGSDPPVPAVTLTPTANVRVVGCGSDVFVADWKSRDNWKHDTSGSPRSL